VTFNRNLTVKFTSEVLWTDTLFVICSPQQPDFLKKVIQKTC